MTANIKATWAVQVPPDDENPDLHEFFLLYYRFSDTEDDIDPDFMLPARPVVAMKFREIEQLKKIQNQFPEAKLGPSSAFTEGLIFTQNWEEAKQLEEKVRLIFRETDDDEIDAIHAEDTLEDL